MKTITFLSILTLGFGLNVLSQKNDSLQILAETYYLKAEYEKSAEIFEQLISENPDNDFYYNAARPIAKTGNKQKAIDYLVKATKNDSSLYYIIIYDQAFEELQNEKEWIILIKGLKKKTRHTKRKWAMTLN